MAEAVRQKRGSQSPRDVCSTITAHRCKDGRHPGRSSHAVEQTEPILSRVRTAGEKAVSAAMAKVALVESDPSNGISTPPFWPPISIRQIPFPHVPGTRRTGKVRRRACGLHMSE